MSLFRVIYGGEPQEDLYDSWEEAEEAALDIISCAKAGAETLFMHNPGDYDEDDWDDEYEIEEVEE